MNNLPDPRNDTGIVPCVDPDPQTSKPPHNYDYIKKLREDRTLSTQFRNASAKLETIAATIHQLQTEPRQYTLNEVRAATDCVFTDTMGLTGDYRNRKLNLMLKDIEVKGTERIGAIAKPSRIKASSPYSNRKRPTYSLIRALDRIPLSRLERNELKKRSHSRKHPVNSRHSTTYGRTEANPARWYLGVSILAYLRLSILRISLSLPTYRPGLLFVSYLKASQGFLELLSRYRSLNP
ncbi:hypothetical protein L6452_27859 [Arctium lappa]|uniref:Uncharacterized protein n=2 Tax=Arctium lappa TaxID=4217 RepID=A0ACB8ZWW3_ARCLA|nr:hypothetical protein L6452_27856 [Arctium lappa]KAI3702133.1 hypothetical protein L6452_27859 [Arctium lappa]